MTDTKDKAMPTDAMIEAFVKASDSNDFGAEKGSFLWEATERGLIAALALTTPPAPQAEGEIEREKLLEDLATHFIVKPGTNADKNQYGHLELWWAGKSVHEEPEALTNPFMLLGSAEGSYGLACMSHLQAIIDRLTASTPAPQAEGEIERQEQIDIITEILNDSRQDGSMSDSNIAVLILAALRSAQASAAIGASDGQIRHMVDRFLGWHLPENFNPDGGISFKRTYNDHLPTPCKYDPTGTNVLDAEQATVMVRYMLEGLPAGRTYADGIEDAAKVADGHVQLLIGHANCDPSGDAMSMAESIRDAIRALGNKASG